MTTFTLNRRALLTGTVALGTVGLLAACGGGSSDKKISGLWQQILQDRNQRALRR